MRPYRGQRKDGKGWVYGWYVKVRKSHLILSQKWLNDDTRAYVGKTEDKIVFEIHSDCHEVIPETVGQSTGLKDKNGKEIYKGDIVEGYSGRALIIYDIPKYGQGQCGFVPEFIDGYNQGQEIWWQKERWYRWEIIGNKWDNPELL